MFFFRFRDKLGVKVVKALKRNDDGVTHAAIDMLSALMQVIIYFVPGDPFLTFKEVKKRKQFSSFITVQNPTAVKYQHCFVSFLAYTPWEPYFIQTSCTSPCACWI